nr:MAG TPA: hypothetical protein [Caudoviricetes sp.]
MFVSSSTSIINYLVRIIYLIYFTILYSLSIVM